MRIGTLRLGQGRAPALVSGDRAALLAEAAAAARVELRGVTDTLALVHDWASLEAPLRTVAERLDELFAGGLVAHPLGNLGAPIARPGKIIAIGRNYADHARELGNDVPTEPLTFVKYTTAVSGPFDPVPRPSFVNDLDYEAELAVVIGRRGRDINLDDALDHVLGYCCANDVSARTAQMATGQFVRGKSFDGFCPLGPAIVTRDEVGDPQNLRITCRVDGETRQDSSTALMIFAISTLIAHCSASTTLEPGDVILTGTPSGVAMGRTPPPWLQPGQLCEVEIEGVGRIANEVVA
ncbi:MAG: fumarylacetoacetate hydrolase family protein [Candidatus Dormibacteraeota bacterium]|nr:fumarylacetoacetate hydrolase family protein [Candidatus Dormibacteraeota bacterium]